VKIFKFAGANHDLVQIATGYPTVISTCVSQWVASPPQLTKKFNCRPSKFKTNGPIVRTRLISAGVVCSFPGACTPFTSFAHLIQRSGPAPRPEPATPIRFSHFLLALLLAKTYQVGIVMANITSSVDATPVPAAAADRDITGDWKHAFNNAVFEQYETQLTNHSSPVYTVCNFPAWSGTLDFIEYLLIASSP